MRLCSLQGAFRFQIFLLRCASKELSGKVVKSHVMHAAGGLLAAKCAGCVVCGACLVAVALPLRFRAAVPSLFSRFLEPLNLAQATGGGSLEAAERGLGPSFAPWTSRPGPLCAIINRLTRRPLLVRLSERFRRSGMRQRTWRTSCQWQRRAGRVEASLG